MEDFLVFRIYGSMVSWGEIAVGEVRPTSDHTGRSTILGLLSAALGIKRTENDRLKEIFNGYNVGLKVLSSGTLLKDYHTVQAPDSSGKTTYATRREEVTLGKNRLGTMLTSREYRCDALSIVSLQSREDSPYSLADLKEALLRPKYTLYLGRKSCPLSLPLSPQIVEAKNCLEALDKVLFPPILVSNASGDDITQWYIKISDARYYWEGAIEGVIPQQSIERYDNPGNRVRWQFAPRLEHSLSSKGRL